MPAVRILTVDDLAPPARLVREGLAEDGAVLYRLERRTRRVPRPVWLDDPAWTFPTWRTVGRPFDWAHDLADLPTPMPWPEHGRMRLYLRPPAPVVQR